MLLPNQCRQHCNRWWLLLLTVVTISSVVVIGARAKNAPLNASSAKESLVRPSEQRSGLRSEAVSSVQLNADSYSVSEGDGTAQIIVTRSGDTSGSASVDYTTLDGTAGQRTKYELAAGTLNFAAGELTKTIRLLINDNTYVDGDQSFYLRLSNASGAGLGLPSLSTITIKDNDTTPSTINLLEDPRTFVRQHYYDFLARRPDQTGWDYWTGRITSCGNDALCLHNARIGVSAQFFIELEFQQTGFVVYRMYRAAYGSRANAPTRANLLYSQFMPDRASLVGGPQLPQSTIDFANRFVERPEFK